MGVETKVPTTHGHDKPVIVHSFVVVNADTNLIFKDVSDLKEWIRSPYLVLQRTLVECDHSAWATETR